LFQKTIPPFRPTRDRGLRFWAASRDQEAWMYREVIMIEFGKSFASEARACRRTDRCPARAQSEDGAALSARGGDSGRTGDADDQRRGGPAGPTRTRGDRNRLTCAISRQGPAGSRKFVVDSPRTGSDRVGGRGWREGH